ncbi:MAG: hypothetical protein Q4G64_00785 [bacterium]|nr:hypothetical protein [bacterium]
MFLALALIVLGYLVPHLTRRQAVVAESRIEDRFSPMLRLVEPVAAPALAERRAEHRVPVLKPEIAQRRTEALAMIRPTAPDSRRVNARELAAARASRAAAISVRAAAGRRRLVLTAVLAALAALLWVLVSTGTLAWGWAVVPTLLAIGVGYLAVQAMLEDRAADAKARAEISRFDQRLRLFRSEEARAESVAAVDISFEEILAPYEGTHSSEPHIDLDAPPKHARHLEPSVFLEIGEDEESRRAQRPVDAPLPQEGGPEWTPVPVPVPTYTLKADVPRREAEAWAPEASPSGAVPERPTQAAPSSGMPVEEAQTFVLDDVLARRRASGA